MNSPRTGRMFGDSESANVANGTNHVDDHFSTSSENVSDKNLIHMVKY